MLRPSAVLLLAALGLIPVGCDQREASRLGDDFNHATERTDYRFQAARSDVKLFVHNGGVEAQELALDSRNFLEWRRREWWVLQDELAWHLAYDTEAIEKLSDDAARYYGYEVTQWPKERQEWLQFFRDADPEWRNLVQDCTVFIERARWEQEGMKLRRDLREFYQSASAEAGNLTVDLDNFLEWRQREWEPLVREAKSFVGKAQEECDAFQRDLDDFRAKAAIEQRRMRAELREFWSEEGSLPPKFADDVTRWTRWRDREWEPLKAEIHAFVAKANWESAALEEDFHRFSWIERQKMPALMMELDDFLAVRRRELTPLSDEAARFWRIEIARGHVLPGEIKEFYGNASVEAALLAQDIDSSIAYSAKEWADLKAHLKTFITYEDSAFSTSDPTAPRGGTPMINQIAPVPRDYTPE